MKNFYILSDLQFPIFSYLVQKNLFLNSHLIYSVPILSCNCKNISQKTMLLIQNTQTNTLIEKESIFFILTDKENTLSSFHSTGISFCLQKTPVPVFTLQTVLSDKIRNGKTAYPDTTYLVIYLEISAAFPAQPSTSVILCATTSFTY